MSRCECGHKIAYYLDRTWGNTSVDVNKLTDEDFRHITDPVEVEIDGKRYLDMTSRRMSTNCPYCDCPIVRIKNIGEDGQETKEKLK